ncbi:MAG: 50S ribosomal protein L10 [Bacteroidaceae bacterium]|nr:50S ribosomal protein L10 [Bacteroidaceae bacterium]
MKKEDKGLLIDSLVESLENYAHFYVVDVTALDSATTSALRRECFKNEIKLQVVKNTLFIKALEKKGFDAAQLGDSLTQTTAIMFANTANKPARLIKDFAKNNNDMPKFKAAYAEDMVYVGAENLSTLVALKSKNELIADVIAALESPIMNVVSALENREEKAEEAAAE